MCLTFCLFAVVLYSSFTYAATFVQLYMYKYFLLLFVHFQQLYIISIKKRNKTCKNAINYCNWTAYIQRTQHNTKKKTIIKFHIWSVAVSAAKFGWRRRQRRWQQIFLRSRQNKRSKNSTLRQFTVYVEAELLIRVVLVFAAAANEVTLPCLSCLYIFLL